MQSLQARMRIIKGHNTRGGHTPSFYILHPNDVTKLEDALPELEEWRKARGFKLLTFDGTPILSHDVAKEGRPLVIMDMPDDYEYGS